MTREKVRRQAGDTICEGEANLQHNIQATIGPRTYKVNLR